MLEELKNLEYRGGKDGLLFFLCDVIGCNEISVRDAEVICSHAPGKQHLSVGDLIGYCLAFGWIHLEADVIIVSSSLVSHIHEKAALNGELIASTINQLFSAEIIGSDMFSYDAVRFGYAFKNELLPLSFSCVRNVLISQGFLVPIRDSTGAKFYVSPTYEELIVKHSKSRRKQLSLARLKEQIEKNELAGEKAELFVLAFEMGRIGQPLCKNIKRISEIDVSAGYDIVSYDSSQSQNPDRFIEVKAASHSGFFWSKNEYEIAKLKADSYYLYLVDLMRINDPGYAPEMIKNPAESIMKADEWFVEPQSYFIKRI